MLTVLSMLCRCLGWYPVWLILLSMNESAAMLPIMGFLLAFSLLSSGCIRLLRLRLISRKALEFRLTLLLTAVSAVLCAVGLRMLGVGLVLSILLSGITVIGTNRKNNAAPQQLFTANAYAAFLSGIVITSIMLMIADLPAHTTLTLCVVGIVSAIFFILRNQFMLRRFVSRRGGDITDIPQDIRRGNLYLVLGIILLLTVIFAFHEPLIAILKQIQEWMIKLVTECVRLIKRLIIALSGDVPNGQAEDISAERPEMPPAGNTNPLWLLIWIPVLAASYYMWRVFISEWIYDIRMLIRRIAEKLRKNDPENDTVRAAENGTYYDTESTVLHEESSRRKRRTWRKALRKWKKLPDVPEKFYQGYRLLLDAPCWQPDSVKNADTVREIRDKWAAYFLPPDALDAVTADFHSDRYAENGLPPDAFRDITKALACVRDLKSYDHS